MMQAAEFKRRAFALVGAHDGWRSRIGRRLAINDRTVRRWLADDDVPDWVAEKLPGDAGGWIVGSGLTPGGVMRDFILHTDWPAFVAWVPPATPDEVQVLVWLHLVDDEAQAEWRRLAAQQFHNRKGGDDDGRGIGAAAAGGTAGAGGGAGRVSGGVGQ